MHPGRTHNLVAGTVVARWDKTQVLLKSGHGEHVRAATPVCMRDVFEVGDAVCIIVSADGSVSHWWVDAHGRAAPG